MSVANKTRPSLIGFSLFSLSWVVCTTVGLGLVVWSLWALSHEDLVAMGAPLALMAAVVVVSELRPVIMTRLFGNPVSISLSFVFATLYLWGVHAALLMQFVAVLVGEVVLRKAWWKIAFNVGQYCLSIALAWPVMAAAGVTPSPSDPLTELSGSDLGWMFGTWVAYHLANLAFVAGLAEDDGQTWWESFSEEFWFYTGAALSVLALSPLIAAAVLAAPNGYTLLPLVLIPLLAVQRTAEMSRRQEYLALHDPLTGLPNRVTLATRIAEGISRARRQPTNFAVILLDLDRFKVINDGLGHAVGDALLVDVANRLRSNVRLEDTLGRFGGDEFILLCEVNTLADLNGIVDRVLNGLSEPFNVAGDRVIVSASVGVVVASEDSTEETLLRDADAAMYRAKAKGRNQSVYFHEAMHATATARLHAETGLRRALQAEQFRIHYQPIVDITTGHPIGLEALLRWNDPARGLLRGDQFVPLAEETDLIIPIGLWVLDRALGQIAKWRREIAGAQDLWIAVNLSARQLSEPGLAEHVERRLAELGLDPGVLHLEITESSVMDNLPVAQTTLKQLQSIGAHIVADDFGTGHSSLAYLQQLPFSSLKIDRSFVAELGTDSVNSRSIVAAIVSLAGALRLGVVAEGIETPHQLDILQDLGADAGQGFLWSPGISADQIPSWLSTHYRTPARITF